MRLNLALYTQPLSFIGLPVPISRSNFTSGSANYRRPLPGSINLATGGGIGNRRCHFCGPCVIRERGRRSVPDLLIYNW